MALLSLEEIVELFAAASSARLWPPDIQETLLDALPVELTAALPRASEPGARLFQTLNLLNRAPPLPGGSAPLLRWIESAIALRSPFREARKLRELADRIAARVTKERPYRFGVPEIQVDFAGRRIELERLAAALGPTDADSRKWIAIAGLAGMGKTVLAHELIETCDDQFSGGIFWADAGTNRDDGESVISQRPRDVVRRILEEWHSRLAPAASLPEDDLEAHVARIVRARAAEAECLLVLDNVDSSAVLRTFLDYFGHCAILVTTRRAGLAVEAGMPVIDLSGLSREDVVELARVTNPERVDELVSDPRVRDTDNHPLAITLLAREYSRSGWRRAAGVAPASVGPLVQLEAAFRGTIANLPPGPSVPMLSALASLSPIGWSLESADYVSGFGNLQLTADAVAVLIDYSLVQVATREGDDKPRFRLHRALRDHVRLGIGARGLARIFRHSWELNLLAPLLVKARLYVSAGTPCYDSRQDRWAQRYLSAHRDSPAEISAERDALLAPIFRRLERHEDRAAVERMQVFRGYLAGADLRELGRLEPTNLDGADLENANLEAVAFGGSPVSWARNWSRWFAWSWRDGVAAGVALVLAALVAVLWSAGRAWATTALVAGAAVFAYLIPRWMFALLISGGRHADWFSERGLVIAESISLAIVSVPGAAIVGYVEECFGGFIFDAFAWGYSRISGICGSHSLALQIAVRLALALSIQSGVASILKFLRPRIRNLAGGMVARLGSACILLAVSSLTLLVLMEVGTEKLSDTLPDAGIPWGLLLVSVWIAGVATSGLPLLYENPDIRWQPFWFPTTYLRRARLRGAKLRRCDLRWVRFNGADLRNADLREADLRGADVTGAQFDGAKLEGARMDGGVHGVALEVVAAKRSGRSGAAVVIASGLVAVAAAVYVALGDRTGEPSVPVEVTADRAAGHVAPAKRLVCSPRPATKFGVIVEESEYENGRRRRFSSFVAKCADPESVACLQNELDRVAARDAPRDRAGTQWLRSARYVPGGRLLQTMGVGHFTKATLTQEARAEIFAGCCCDAPPPPIE